jgi:NADPH:quinone reductase-like Zn-dependent oxidoreductase
MSAIPETMTAVLLTGFGGFDRLSVRDDVPTPRPGKGEVLLRIGAAGVNNTDVNTRIGWYAKAGAADPDQAAGDGPGDGGTTGWRGDVPRFPRIQGADACGRIVAVGPGVPESRIGERVIVEPVFLPEETGLPEVAYFGSEWDGAFAEYARVPARHAFAVSTALSDVELASFPCSGSAALNMIARSGVQAGERVLVTGASGGVGALAVQLAASRGAAVTAVADPSKKGALLALGAELVAPRSADLAAEFGRDAFHVVIDVVGGPTFPALLDVLRPRGRYAAAGAIAGPLVTLDLRTLYLKDLTLRGCTVLDAQVFPDLVAAIEEGEIRPVVAATFPMKEIVRAQQAFLGKAHTGKIVLVP